MSLTATMTALEWEARVAETNGKWLAHWVKTTDSGKLDWTPIVDGNEACRSVYEQVRECVTLLHGAAALLRGEAWPSTGEGSAKEFGCGNDACEAVVEASQKFGDTLRKCDDSVWQKNFKMPWGDASGAMLISMVVGNLQYHGGQINAIQMMLGDQEFHYPKD